MNFLKSLVSSMSLVSLVMMPIAQGAQAKQSQKQRVAQYLKATNLSTQKTTVRDYWRMVRHVYPQDVQQQMDRWVGRHGHEMMPEIRATSFKDGQGREQVRLNLKKNNRQVNLTLSGGEEPTLQVNGVTFSKAEMKDLSGAARKYYQKDASFKKYFDGLKKPTLLKQNLVLTYQDFNKLSKGQKVQYLLSARKTLESANLVMEKAQAKTASYQQEPSVEQAFWNLILGEQAEANLGGKSCIVAGYISKYGGDSQSCGGTIQGRKDLEAQMGKYQAKCTTSGSVPCNPLVYGFKSGTEAYCVPPSNVKYATSYCNRQSPLNDVKDKKRIIESFAERNGNTIDLKFDEEGKVSEDQYKQISEYLKGLNTLVADATKLCDSDADFAKIKNQRPDQADACEALKIRAFDLQTLSAKNEAGDLPGVPVATTPTSDCTLISGSNWDESTKKCICADGQQEKTDESGARMCSILVADGGTTGVDTTGVDSGPKAKPEKSWWSENSDWLIPVGLLGLGAGLYWWWLKDATKAETPVYVPPPTPPLDETKICNAGQVLIGGVCTTPVELPPSNPCPAPNTQVNGVCVPPEVSAPEVGTTVAPTGGSGGVILKPKGTN